jgi:protein-disulfide isomerase
MRQVDDWEALARPGHVLGRASAPIKIVEFADYQCPYCGSAAEALHRMVERSHGRIAVVYRHYPLTRIHPYALDAALAAECASNQGRFAAYHDALFRFQDSLGVWAWTRYAQVAGIADTTRLKDCVVHQRTLSRIEHDRAVGDSLHLTGTPTFIAAGKLFSGMPPDSVWYALLGLAS